MNNLVASAVLDSSSCDPYAFPMDDPIVEEVTGNLDSSGRSMPQTSLYSKRFLMQKSSAPNGKMLLAENGFYPNQNELSMSQYSVNCDSLSVLQHNRGPGVSLPEAKGNNSAELNEVFSNIQASENGLTEDFTFSGHLAHDMMSVKNGASSWTLAAESESSQKTNKKKRRNKVANGEGNDVKRRTKKTVKNILESGSDTNAGAGKCGLLPWPNQGIPSSDSQYLWDNHGGILCAKNAAPQLPAKSSAAKIPVMVADSICWGMPVQSIPTTTTITTMSNSVISNGKFGKCTPSTLRQAGETVESQGCQPASSGCDISGKSDSSNKQGNSIPLSKVMEIIEREKARGSPSPCKRRRSAKPQHIQNAEEEARKFVSTGASNNIEKRLGGILTPGNQRTHSAKKGLDDSLQCSGFKAEGTVSSKKSKKLFSSGSLHLDTCSTTELPKAKAVFHDVASHDGGHASTSGVLYGGAANQLCNSVASSSVNPQTQSFQDSLGSDSVCGSDIQQHFTHQRDTSQTPVPVVNDSYSQQPCTSVQVTGITSSSTQFDTLNISSGSPANFNQLFMQFSTYQEQTLPSPCHAVSGNTETSSIPSFKSSFYSSHSSLPSQAASPAQWLADSPVESSASGIISQTMVTFSQTVNNPHQQSEKTRSQGVSVSTAGTEWKPYYNGSVSETDSFPLHQEPASPSSFSASCLSKPAHESASLNCSPGPDKLHPSAVLPPFGALVANSIGSCGEQIQSQLNKMWPQTKVDSVTLPQQQQKKKSVRKKRKSSDASMGNTKKQQASPRMINPNPVVYEGKDDNFPGDTGSLHSLLKLDASSVKSEVKVNGTQTYSGSNIVLSPAPNPSQELPSPYYLVQSPSQTLPSLSKPPPSPYWQMPSVSRLPQSPDQPTPSSRQPTHSPVPKMEPFLTPNTPEEELEDRLRYNKVESVPQCGCLGPNYVFNESVEGPYYTQLGTARNLVDLREIMEKRTGLSGNAIRIEKIRYTGKEGRSAQGCPIAKWIIRRSGLHEKYLCVTRKRPGHFCDTAYIIVTIVAWEGVASERADTLYTYLVSTLTKFGLETDRRCGTNEQKTCACQGADIIRRGASFSFGCSWSMYFNGCKFGRSHTARKFKLKDAQKETEMEEQMQNLATVVAPLYKAVAPDAYRNQVHFEDQAKMCRLGTEKGRPFSGVTACVDFCAHSHKDFHNMQNGSTVVVTLTKHRGLSKSDDEQLHVLPLYALDDTDENGSVEGQMEKVKAGSLEILHKYTLQARTRSAPVTPKKRVRTPKKDSPARSEAKQTGSEKVDSSSVPSVPSRPTNKEKDSSCFHSQDSSHSLPDAATISGNSMHTPEKIQGLKDSSFMDKENLSGMEEDIWSQAVEPLQLYDKVWDYLCGNGTFPPPSCMDKKAAAHKLATINPQSSAGETAGRECRSLANSLHGPSHPMQQAANVPSQHHCTSSDPEKAGLFAQNPINRVKVEPSSNLSNTCEFQNLTSNGYHNSSSTSRGLSSQQVRGATDDLSQDIGMPVSTVLGSSLDVLSEAAFVNGQAPDQSSLCPLVSPCPPQVASAPGSRPSFSSATLPPGLPYVLPVAVTYPITTISHSTSDNQSSYPISSTTPSLSAKTSCDGETPNLCNDPLPTSSSSHPVMQPNGSFIMPTLGQGPNEPTFTMLDPSVVKCEWQDNEEIFLDRNIGGVAIALNHGAVLFEVAKREVHATTALKNPNRYQPTRISLVFYQHKNLNYSHHGYYEYEHKLKAQRQKRMEKLMEEGATAAEAELAVKPSRKRKKKADGEEEEEVVDFAKTSAAQYKYMWDTTVRHSQALTTDSIITRWIDPQPMVTGPYQRWV